MSRKTMLNASAMAALCALAAFALQAKAQEQATSAAGPVSAAYQDGMVVVRDAQTGKMRAPTADELKLLRPRSATSAAARQIPVSQPQTLAPRRDGARGVRLGDKTLVYEVVTRGPDGKLSGQCVQGDAAASQVLNGAQHSASGASAIQSGQAAAVQHKEHVHEAR